MGRWLRTGHAGAGAVAAAGPQVISARRAAKYAGELVNTRGAFVDKSWVARGMPCGLPDEIWLLILGQLGERELVTLAATCRRLFMLVSDDSLWKALVGRQWGALRFARLYQQPSLIDVHPASAGFWKRFYRTRSNYIHGRYRSARAHHTAGIQSFALVGKNLIATGNQQGSVSLYDVNSGCRLEWRAPAHSDRVMDIAALDSERFAAASIDGLVSLWDTSERGVAKVLADPDGQAVWRVVGEPRRRSVLTMTSEAVRRWSADGLYEGAIQFSGNEAAMGQFATVSADEQGRGFAIAHLPNRTLMTWTDGDEIGDAHRVNLSGGGRRAVMAAGSYALYHAGGGLNGTAAGNCQVYQMDLTNETERSVLARPIGVSQVSLDESRQQLLAADWLGAIVLHDLRSDSLAHQLAGRTPVVAFESDDFHIVSAHACGRIAVWDRRRTAALLHEITAAHAQPLTGIAMRANMLVSSAADGMLRVYDFGGW